MTYLRISYGPLLQLGYVSWVSLSCEPGRENMAVHLDILKRQKDGTFVWVDVADNLEAARARLYDLRAASPGEYFVFDAQVLQVVPNIERETESK